MSASTVSENNSSILSLTIIALISFLSLALPFFAGAQATTTSETTATSTATTTSAFDPHNSTHVEAQVREAFADAPVMIEIARCESKFRQFDPMGGALDGGAGGMIGIFQIHRASHEKAATGLGLDIDSLEGNIGYARHLYTKEGTDPWISSFPCWKNTSATNAEATGAPHNGPITKDLSFGMMDPQVQTLQQLLNKAGFTVATEGPGSTGNETTKFGNFTRDAVRRFQCAKQLVCSGDEYSTGYGFVGSRTRGALAELGAAPSSAPPVVQASSPSSSSSDEQKVAELTAQIANLLKLISELQAQLAALKAQQ